MASEFPKSEEEFLELLSSFGAAEPEKLAGMWRYSGDAVVLQWSLLRAIWEYMENPAESTFEQGKLDRRLARAEQVPTDRRRSDRIAERILEAGVSAEDLSTLVLSSQIDLVFRLLYQLDDNECWAPFGLGERGYGLFETEGGVPKGAPWCLDHLHWSAKPPGFPEEDELR